MNILILSKPAQSPHLVAAYFSLSKRIGPDWFAVICTTDSVATVFGVCFPIKRENVALKICFILKIYKVSWNEIVNYLALFRRVRLLTFLSSVDVVWTPSCTIRVVLAWKLILPKFLLVLKYYKTSSTLSDWFKWLNFLLVWCEKLKLWHF